MPVSEYYSGKGKKVMRSMKSQYGKETGERVFYATANKMKKKPHGSDEFSQADIQRGYRLC